MANLQIATCNVQGLQTNPNKLKAFYQRLPDLGIGILTETNLDSYTLIKPTHNPPENWTTYTSRHPTKMAGSGVTILVGPGLKSHISQSQILVPGYLIALTLKIAGYTYLVFGVYNPPRDENTTEQLLSTLSEIIASTSHTHLIIAGDLNAGLRQLDRSKTLTIHDRKWISFVNNMSLTDIIAYKHPTTSEYTYTNSKGGKSAIDHILVSDTLLQACRKAEVKGGQWKVADHYSVSANFNTTPQVPNYRPTVRNRVPTSRLDESDLRQDISRFFTNNPPQEDEDTWKWWARLKKGLSDRIVAHTNRKNRDEQKQRERLEKRISENKQKIPRNPEEALRLYRIEQRHNLALSLLENKAQKRKAALLNKIAKLDIDFESYTTNRLAHSILNGTGRNATALRHPQTKILHTDTKGMLEVALQFYKDLLGPRNREEETTYTGEKFLPLIPKLTQTQIEQMEAPVTEKEVKGLFQRLKPGKAPGYDGIGNDVYKAFSDIIAPVFTKVAEEFQRTQHVPPEILMAVITPFYKEKGAREDLKNWRPITLVTTDYKLLALFLGSRLTPVMDHLVGPGQTSSVPGRTTFDNIHSVRLAHYLSTLDENIDAVFVFIDSEKAFDRVSWPYLWETLSIMNIPQNFIAMIMALYEKATAMVRVNGYLTAPFPLGRGVRQGCPTSPLLYVLSLEPIRHYIHEKVGSANTQWLPRDFPASFAHADDLTIITTSSEVASLVTHTQIYAELVLRSGLKINMEKSIALYTRRDRLPTPPQRITIPSYHWEDDAHGHLHLGLPIGGSNPDKKAVEIARERLRKKLKQVAPSRLPWLEKARILGARTTGCLQFYAQTISIPEKDQQEIQIEIRNAFYGPNNPVKNFIRDTRLFVPRQKGGTGLPSIQKWTAAFHFTHIVRLHRGIARPSDKPNTTYIDPTLPIIFKAVINKIGNILGYNFDPSTFFWQDESTILRIASKLPNYWRIIVKNYNDMWAHNNSWEKIYDHQTPLDAYFSAQKAGKIILYNEATKRLSTTTPQEQTAALTLTQTQAYLMPLLVDPPADNKGLTKLYYNAIMALSISNAPNTLTPETEWTRGKPALTNTAESGLRHLKETIREIAWEARRGNNLTAYYKSHAWLLYQRRLKPIFMCCNWCNQKLNINQQSQEEEEEAPSISELAFIHEAWICPGFRAIWNNARKMIRLPFISSIAEIALGVDPNTGKVISPKTRAKALALHAAIWSQRTKAELDYKVLHHTYKRIVPQYIKTKIQPTSYTKRKTNTKHTKRAIKINIE